MADLSKRSWPRAELLDYVGGLSQVAGVAESHNLPDVLMHIGNHGHRHHFSFRPGDVQAPVELALAHYLDFEVSLPQNRA